MGQYIDKSNRLVRWAIIVSNALSGVGCCILVSVGIWTLLYKSFLSGLLLDRLFLSCAYLQVGAGLVCLVNCFFGCYSAFKEVKSLLVVHVAISVLLLTMLVMGGVMAYIFRHQVQDNMKAQLVLDLRNYNPQVKESAITRSWDLTQIELECCGMATEQVEKSWHIWRFNTVINPGPVVSIENTMVPRSCCRNGVDCMVNNETQVGLIWTGDCYERGRQFLESHSQVMGGVNLGVAIVMVAGILLSVLLFRRIR